MASHAINYLGLVQSTLAEKWRSYKKPPSTNPEDLQVATELLTNIAVVRTDYLPLNGRVSPDHEDMLGAKSPEDLLVAKIKGFVKDKAFAFREICETKFPFSRFESSIAETALGKTLEYGTDSNSILFHAMTLDPEWKRERELSLEYGEIDTVLQVTLKEIREACNDFHDAYERGDLRAGYYLLWLIKYTGGCEYQIPPKESFSNSTVREVLSHYISSGEEDEFRSFFPDKFVELLGLPSFSLSRLCCKKNLLDEKAVSAFYSLVIRLLIRIRMDAWPNKESVLIEVLQRKSFVEGRLLFAKSLTSSKDDKTALIGTHLVKVFEASSFREAIPHLEALKQLLPNLDSFAMERIFGRVWVEFRQEKLCGSKDPDFTRRLQFNGSRQVIVHNSLMMGVYVPERNYRRRERIPHLLAYDMTTEKMVWGIPLAPIFLDNPSLNLLTTPLEDVPYCSISQVDQSIALKFIGEKVVRLIDPNTGELISSIELPEILTDEYDRLHLAQEGLAYQMVYKEDGVRILIGGKIAEGRWDTTFKIKTPRGGFCSLSTHCGFDNPLENQFILVGPTGDQVVIAGVREATAKDDKLYLIRKDEERSIFTVRTLKRDKEVVSDVEKEIPLEANEVSFIGLCKNGQWILGSSRATLFVDVEKENVSYVQSRPFLHRLVNTESGELWEFDPAGELIWKVTPTQAAPIGTLESGTGTALLHVDKHDRLYFVDIPF